MVTVTINVLDVNDNAPVCDQSPLMIMGVVEANSNSVRLGVLMATDIDSGVNAAVLFSVFSGDFEELFSINSAVSVCVGGRECVCVGGSVCVSVGVGGRECVCVCVLSVCVC